MELKGIELMGENLKERVKYCGDNVKFYPLAKIIHPENFEIDDNSEVFDFAFLSPLTSIKIGKYTRITWHCLVEGWGEIEIGNRVFLGPGSKILSSTYALHGYYSAEHLCDSKDVRKSDKGKVEICDDAYIGANSVVMPGVTIGEGAVVGANSLVDHNLKPWGIYFGNPVKRIGTREKPTDERRAIVESMDWTKHF